MKRKKDIASLFLVFSLVFPCFSLAAVTADDGFHPNPDNSVVMHVTQPDGKIIVGRLFNSIAGQARSHIARLHPDGSLDVSFHPGATNGLVAALALQPDGKIVVGGTFSMLGGTSVASIGRTAPLTQPLTSLAPRRETAGQSWPPQY